MWTTLLPSFGARARFMRTAGVLKLGRGAEHVVARSVLTFVDGAGAVVGQLSDAFGLTAGTSLAAPSCLRLFDERQRPPTAVSMRWHVDGIETSEVPVIDEPAQRGELTLWCAPVHVPVREDHQLYVHLVNLTDSQIDLPAVVRSAILWVDGVAYPSVTGVHWDGRAYVHANGWSHQDFRLADFEGAPALGAHALAIEMAGRRSVTRSVLLEGEPWSPRPRQ
jgi:hypothetical protein